MYQTLMFERQELSNQIIFTQRYLDTCEDETERKHITYQLNAMLDYKSALESRISIHRKDIGG